jgi:hypothetical protein
MRNLLLPKENYAPYVSFNQHSGIFEIRGESHMEYPQQFYKPILAWLEEFLRQSKSPIEFNFRMSYYNTGSSRMFFEILALLEDRKAPVVINWYVHHKDVDMIDEGESFQEDFPLLDFNVIVQQELTLN